MIVIPVVSPVVFLEFLLVSTQRQSEDGEVGIFAQQMNVLGPKILGTEVDGVPPLTNIAAKTSFGEDLVKIRPVVAEQSR